MDKCKHSILAQLPAAYRLLLEPVSFNSLEEIRFRANQPVMLYFHENHCYLHKNGGTCSTPDNAKRTVSAELSMLASSLCNHSVYAHTNDMKDGFITLRGGHRVGLAGKAVIKEGKVNGLCDISGINIRIAKPHTGCAGDLLPQLKTAKGVFLNTLLIAPPQCGKTTMLRDLARMLSTHYKIAIIDERSEIAGTFEGVPQFDLGYQTDVLDRFPKVTGMLLALRSLSPQVLITDEVGSDADIEAMERVRHTGCQLLASVHGDSIRTLLKAKPRLLSLFDVAVLMGRRNNCPAVLEVKEVNNHD
ncbi:MAG: stage III sporulation protein AA [Clostridia bacterium]|nr:stage III sporulation protein AA [Clostridia bacterium]